MLWKHTAILCTYFYLLRDNLEPCGVARFFITILLARRLHERTKAKNQYKSVAGNRKLVGTLKNNWLFVGWYQCFNKIGVWKKLLAFELFSWPHSLSNGFIVGEFWIILLVSYKTNPFLKGTYLLWNVMKTLIASKSLLSFWKCNFKKVTGVKSYKTITKLIQKS